MDNKLMVSILEALEQATKETNKRIDTLGNRVHEDISELRREQTNMHTELAKSNAIQAKQQGILEEHIKRTEINERAIELQRTYVEKNFEAVRSEISPLKKHDAMWAGASKLIAIVGVVAGIVAAIYKILL